MPQSIATNTGVAIAGRAIQVALGLAVVSALTRILGNTAFGVYSTLLAYGSLLLIGADLGLYLTFTRAAGRESPVKSATLLSEVAWVRLTALLLVFVVGGIVLSFLPILENLGDIFWLAAAGFMAQSLSQLLMGVFQARGSIWRASVGDLVGRTLQLILVLGVPAFAVARLQNKDALALAIFAFTTGTVAAFIFHAFLLPVSWRPQKPPSLARAVEIVRASWPAAALLALNAIYFRIDVLLLSAFRPESEVGVYGLAYRIIESALFLPAAFGGLLLPRLSRGSALHTNLFQESLQAVLWAGSGACLILALLSAPLIQFLSGTQFLAAAPLLTILTFALFVMFLGNVFGFTLVARGQERALMWLYGGLVVFNVVANLLTIPAFGATAAAIVTVATEILAATVAGLLIYRLSPYTLSPKFILKLALVLGVTAAALVFLPESWHVLLQAALACGLFVGISVMLGLVSSHQFRTLLAKP